jgi:hypothetical protein
VTYDIKIYANFQVNLRYRFPNFHQSYRNVMHYEQPIIKKFVPIKSQNYPQTHSKIQIKTLNFSYQARSNYLSHPLFCGMTSITNPYSKSIVNNNFKILNI